MSQPQTSIQPQNNKSANPDISVEEFFKTFGHALTDGDLALIKKCWAVPSFVLGNNVQMIIKTEAEVEKFFSGTKEQYNRRGILEAIPEVESIQWLTNKIALAGVRWPYLDKDGKALGEESSCYTLKADERGELKIYMVVLQGEKKEDSLSH